ncbi:MAG: hypothetical protein K0S66_2004 [Sphingomonas sp.]|nr:hypothetical protein [Sphingomonas sp.]
MTTRVGSYRRLVSEYAALCRELAQLPQLPELGVHSTMRALSCGARTRAGQPCRRTDLADSGRCRFHGGASTGPKTQAGKDRARANLSLRWRDSNDQENT